MRPLVAVEGDDRQFRATWAMLCRDGWTVVGGLPPQPAGRDVGTGVHAEARVDARLVHAGVVDSPASAGEALLAALTGAGVLLHAVAPRAVLDLLYQDLAHLGPLEVWAAREEQERQDALATATTPARPAAGVLPPEQQQILRLLLAGHTLAQAAHRLSVSRRTADRRVAAARRFFGASSTAAALRAARDQLGDAPRRLPEG
ncbi:MAG TPA: helix-turn-helix domain-containing protein [Dermatophilaceae bacterium]|nr:helix-turn-helix domain-containing protein [Dermatophilaceae bacterium]